MNILSWFDFSKKDEPVSPPQPVPETPAKPKIIHRVKSVIKKVAVKKRRP